ncbi:hypothetical protein PFTANZ_06091, partial [Plasmodium falciparum Tanzania (2000708)]
VNQGDDGRCSGDGEACDSISTHDYSTVPSFNCPGCGKHCSSYRKWIERKKHEYDKLKKIYHKQKTDAKSDNEFCKNLKTWSDAAKFLNRLKNGPCKNNNDDDNDNVKDEIDFGDVNGKTFQHTEYCGPCPKFKTNCQNGDCKGAKEIDCKSKKTIDAKDIEKMQKATKINILVSDNFTTKFDGLEACEHAHIFKGIKENEWECGYLCGVDICKPKILNENKDGKEYIQIRTFFKRWLEHFLKDYNKIKQNISPCTNNNEQSPCINGCEQKCECVKKWVEIKTKEWNTIRDRFNEQYNVTASQKSYQVKSFLEDLQSQMDVTIKKAIKPCPRLDELQKSRYCNATANTENDIQKDVVLCLLDKLKKDAENCQNQPSGTPCTQTTSQQTLEEEDLPLEEEENPVTQPGFCPSVEEKKKEEEEDDCNPASPAGPESSGTEGTNGENEDGKPKVDEDSVPKDEKENA